MHRVLIRLGVHGGTTCKMAWCGDLDRVAARAAERYGGDTRRSKSFTPGSSIRVRCPHGSVKRMRDANEVVDEFADELAGVFAHEGWQLLRFGGHSDRSFAASDGTQELVRFTAKLSQSSPGFWGLGIQKAATMIEPPEEHLVLLTASDEGYFISPARLRALIPTFSRDDHDRDHKIGEGKVRREQRFRSLEELTELFRQRVGA